MRIIPILLVLGATVGCVRTSRNPATGRVDVDVESPTKTGEDWRGEVKGIGAMMQLSGTAKAEVSNGVTAASMSLTGARAGGSHPWHIHLGRCGSGGPIVGDPNLYPPLVIGDNGSGAASARLQLQLDEAKEYYVNVHASMSEMENIVACGQIDD